MVRFEIDQTKIDLRYMAACYDLTDWRTFNLFKINLSYYESRRVNLFIDPFAPFAAIKIATTIQIAYTPANTPA